MTKCPNCNHEWDETAPGLVRQEQTLVKPAPVPYKMDERVSRLIRTIHLIDSHQGEPTVRQSALNDLRDLLRMIHSKGEALTDDLADYFHIQRSKTSNGFHTVGKWCRIIQFDIKWRDLISRRDTGTGSMYSLTPLGETVLGPQKPTKTAGRSDIIDIEPV